MAMAAIRACGCAGGLNGSAGIGLATATIVRSQTNSVTMPELCPFKPPMKVTWLDGERPAVIPDSCESRRTKSLMLLICS
jgi:hypothetical protein